jgi:hypothetical protein
VTTARRLDTPVPAPPRHPRQTRRSAPASTTHAHLLGAYDDHVTLDDRTYSPASPFHMLRHGDTYTAVPVDPFGVAVWWTKP